MNESKAKRLLKKVGAHHVRNFGRRMANVILYHGNTKYCPVCERGSSSFRPFNGRRQAECVWCGAKERHRVVWEFWRQRKLFDEMPGRRMLHIAPEYFFEVRLRKLVGEGYLTADLFESYADVKMDVQDIQCPDNSFDMIYCNHVLEHVDDDRKALREFYRILKPGGWATLMVPDYRDKTIEDPTVKDPAERLRLFRQEDHVRDYGPDFADRPREAGFEVEVAASWDFVSPEMMTRMALQRNGARVYFCRKPAQMPAKA